MKSVQFEVYSQWWKYNDLDFYPLIVSEKKNQNLGMIVVQRSSQCYIYNVTITLTIKNLEQDEKIAIQEKLYLSESRFCNRNSFLTSVGLWFCKWTLINTYLEL